MRRLIIWFIIDTNIFIIVIVNEKILWLCDNIFMMDEVNASRFMIDMIWFWEWFKLLWYDYDYPRDSLKMND